MTWRVIGRALLLSALVAVAAQPAAAQLDPLLYVKRVPPNVIVIVDTSPRMLEDLDGYYYDPYYYRVADNSSLANLLGVSSSATYRRKYLNLRNTNLVSTGTPAFTASTIVGVPAVYDPATPSTANSPSDLKYLEPTRLGIARRGIISAISQNAGIQYRWGLMKLRQNQPAWRTNKADCSKPVEVADVALAAAGDQSDCNAGGEKRFGIYDPAVSGPNSAVASASTSTVVAAGAGTASTIIQYLQQNPVSSTGLIPAGQSTATFEDRPIAVALTDAKAAVSALMAGDAAATLACRNSIVVLITSGGNSGDATYLAANDAEAVAQSFTAVSGNGVTRRVPIYVVAIAPPVGEETDLQDIATKSGGQYFHMRDAESVTWAINLAVQAGFSRVTDFQTGTPSEFTGVSPIIGTVNLVGASDATGVLLERTEIHVDNDTAKPIVPQRSNVLISAGFTLPGFEGKIRAFRTFIPMADTSKVSGWRFESAGTKLWPDLDGRAALAGTARAPADANKRNIYTAIPDGTGGVTVVPFTAANAATLAPHLRLPTTISAADFIAAYRILPIGAIVGSTPALMDAPSLDPPPDPDYGRADDSTLTFAATHKNRRSIVFVGANDGMIHAIDARTGYEIWAFIPYNLLPKLKAWIDHQAVEQFDYFVDSSPKIAEVKMNTATGHKWRSLLIIGEGPGGTFYQAFDVTEAGMTVAPHLGTLADVDTLLQAFDTPGESIQFLWSFPNYSSFDPTISETITVSDATPGGQVKVYGDLKSTATYAEKTVGYTWSDPAVGPLDQNRTINVVMVGSGYLPPIEQSDKLQRGASAAPLAGSTFYLLKVEDGTLLGNPTGTSCATGFGCVNVGDDVASSFKNALQADPSAAGDNGLPLVKKAYLGDLDGRYWRFNFDETGAISASALINTTQPIFSSSALLFIGSADVYMFFSTGSDLLPVTATNGVGTFRLYALKDVPPAGPALEKFKYLLAPVSAVGGLANGERPSTAPSVAGDIVFFTTTTENATDPCSNFTANLYAFTYLGGAAYDTNNTNSLDNNDTAKVREMLGRATAPFIVDQHLYLGTAGNTGMNIEMFGDPEDFNNGVGQVGIRVLSWREIR